jgi:hypothetical protein
VRALVAAGVLAVLVAAPARGQDAAPPGALEGPAPYGGIVVTNTTNLFPSPVGDLGVLRGTLQAIGGV